jgi:hypothetical protein
VSGQPTSADSAAYARLARSAGVPLAIEAPCRATAELPPAERARRAYAALSALVG